ncbi:uncharacterized protein LOC123037340 [Drosophila rhopaloa]|uniref:Peptidase aspartic putative domain-containing protein n=1 Tax=Drosophila rhopaloa TaxID=1041015 RepID=A0ABM5J3J9_DRORH|nr:uncharacterized protein LOC123037340 [Drosophila rhopaloa]
MSFNEIRQFNRGHGTSLLGVEVYHTTPSSFSAEEQACEDHFVANVQWNTEGRVQVRLPLKEGHPTLGSSFEMASKRFNMLERKLSHNPELKRQYHQFMQEYIDQGHMSRLEDIDWNHQHFFIPHHCVLRPQSNSTKLRVVFDASAKSSNGQSLNDILMTGPTIQQDLVTTILSFRLHKYVLSGDISKMYRQFVVDERDRKYQLILWKGDSEKLHWRISPTHLQVSFRSELAYSNPIYTCTTHSPVPTTLSY